MGLPFLAFDSFVCFNLFSDEILEAVIALYYFRLTLCKRYIEKLCCDNYQLLTYPFSLVLVLGPSFSHACLFREKMEGKTTSGEEIRGLYHFLSFGCEDSTRRGES